MFGISPMQLIIILVIVVLLFGTKKLRSLGGDLGSAVKGFKKAISDKDESDDKDESSDADFKADGSKEVEDKSAQTEQAVDDLNQADKKTESKAE